MNLWVLYWLGYNPPNIEVVEAENADAAVEAYHRHHESGEYGADYEREEPDAVWNTEVIAS